MIYITSGTCGTTQGYKTSADGALSLPAAEEKRLVSRSVAAYVTKPVIGAVPSDKTPADGPDPDRLPQDTSDGDEPTEGESGPSDGMSVAALERMTKADLEQMAQDMGIDISGAKNNRERAERIAAAETDGDGEDAPELEDGDIVR